MELPLLPLSPVEWMDGRSAAFHLILHSRVSSSMLLLMYTSSERSVIKKNRREARHVTMFTSKARLVVTFSRKPWDIIQERNASESGFFD